MESYHVIDKKVDSSSFFNSLGIYFKDATTLFIEGTSISPIPLKCYNDNLQDGDYLPDRGTLFPKSIRLRCKFSVAMMNELSLIAGHQAEAELMDHFHLYKGDEPVIVWWDAFSDKMLVSNTVSKEIVDQFCTAIALKNH